MLSNRLEFDISAITSSLKDDLASSLVGASQQFFTECKTVVTHYVKTSQPKEAEVYQAALLYMKGQISEDIEYLYDLVAFGLYMPLESLGNKCVAADPRKLEILLRRYRDEASRGELWEMAWLGMLQAYYHPPVRYGEQDAILQFLKDTYSDVVDNIGYTPLWLKTVEQNPYLLAREPCKAFAEDWLAGERGQLQQIARDLHIRQQSWFWQELTRTCVRYVLDMPDDRFKNNISRVLALIEERPGCLDEDLNTILYRYNQCAEKEAHEELKNFALRHWGNPKMRFTQGSKWIHLHIPVWHMVMGWVNEANLRRFFEKISARHGIGGDRLTSWLRYIAWTKSIAHYDSDRCMQKDPALLNLFEMEEAVLCEENDKRLDAFIAKLGEYLGTAV